MGLFWNLMQQSQIKDQQQKSESLESRVAILEQELLNTRTTLHNLVALLERHFGQDIDRDGRIG